jgi:uncharacterized membrane protein YdjX (TVP38/TMEM64 family)
MNVKQMKWYQRTWLWLIMALLGLVFLCSFGSLKDLYDQTFLVMQLHKIGSYAALLFVLFFTGATLVGFPSNVMIVAGGAVFGLVWGTVWSVVGSTLGAIGAFLLARYLLRDWTEARFGQHLTLCRFNQAISHNSLSCVLAVRLTPISPFSLVNFLFGLTPIDLKPYAVGTFFGIIPRTLAYTWLGISGNQAVHGGNLLPFVVVLILLILLSILPFFARKKQS